MKKTYTFSLTKSFSGGPGGRFFKKAPLAAGGILIVIFFLFGIGLSIPAGAQEPERIKEEIEVVNVEVPVRVYYKKKPVKGLGKEDFKLFIDEKERPIHGFYEVHKKLKTAPAGAPRLFVLVFNISASGAGSDMEQGLRHLFEKLIRPNDRVMVLTNNIFLKERTVEDPQKEVQKIKKIVNVESLKMKQSLSSLEFNLRYLTAAFKLEMSNTPGRTRSGMQDRMRSTADKETAINNFIDNYRNYFYEFKEKFFNPDEAMYLEVAEYLGHREIEKWVLYFYQAPLFPQLSRTGGSIYKMIDDFYRENSQLNAYVFDTLMDMGKPDKAHVQEMSKIFLNTGATFHTLLMKPGFQDSFGEYAYQPVVIDSEYVARETAGSTGGSIINSNDIITFIEKITSKEDVYYMLTYVPEKGEKRKKLRVEVSDKKYRLVYDDWQRPKFLERMAKRVEKEMPRIRFRQVEVKEGFIFVRISGVRLAPAPGEEKREGESEVEKGKIILNIKVLNNRAREIAGTSKAFICKAPEIPLRLRLPSLEKGEYQMILEVSDLLSGSNDLELKEIKTTEDHTLEPGQEPFYFVRAPVSRISDASTAPEPAGSAGGKGKAGIHRWSESIEPEILPLILENVAEYCSRLEAISLNFFCMEEVDEIVYHALAWRGGKGKSESGSRNQLSYGYQLVKEGEKLLEKRALFAENGVENLKENSRLKTRFKYRHIVYGPLIFNRRSQPFYHYRIIAKNEWKGKNAYIIEAVPRSNENRQFTAGRFWVDDTEYSILRIEIYQDSLRNFDDIEKMAEKRRIEPYITIVNEYDIVKKGVRFPSRLYYEEAYRQEKGNMMVQAVGNVIFKDYQFFTIETKVTEETQE